MNISGLLIKGAIAGATLITFLEAARAQDLKLGNEGTYPPFSMVGTDGSLSGMEPDLAREMCKRMAMNCDIQAMDLKALLPSLVTGKIDMIVSHLAPLPEQLEKAELSRPVILNPDVFVVPKEWSKGFSDEDLKGLRVGVQRGTSHADFIAKQRPSATAVPYDNPDQLILDILAGRLDAAFAASINMTINLIDKPEGAKWKLSEEHFWPQGSPTGMSWAVAKGNTELINKVNTALDSMIKDCTYTNIRKKYLSLSSLPEEAKCL